MLDSRGVLKLLDFGIARQSHNEAATYQMTQPGMVVGSFNYMAPEQHLGENVDQRSDIFAVGAVLYQVIALKQAFPGREGAVSARYSPQVPCRSSNTFPMWTPNSPRSLDGPSIVSRIVATSRPPRWARTWPVFDGGS